MSSRLAVRHHSMFCSPSQDKTDSLKTFKKFESLILEGCSNSHHKPNKSFCTSDLISKQKVSMLVKSSQSKADSAANRSFKAPTTQKYCTLNSPKKMIQITPNPLLKDSLEKKRKNETLGHTIQSSSSSNIVRALFPKPHSARTAPPIKSEKSIENFTQITLCEKIPKSNNFTRKKTSRSKTSATCTIEDNMVEGKLQELLMKDHLHETYLALKTTRELPAPDIKLVKARQISLPRKPGCENKKTLIFDMDETLIHCEESKWIETDAQITITLPTGEKANSGINIRPYAVECLREASKLFEVIVFTAAERYYANAVLDILDPRHEFIHHRLYRESCICVDGIMVKDLRIFLDRKIQDIAIVDNSVYSFAFQLDNGIPIISWTNRKEDKELLNLIDYLKQLSEADDIRAFNRKRFKLRAFYQDYVDKFVDSN
ncbi:unnamed protein product [Blepharisma stoltei]|uniref:FCP1 homology domain-containing protein n=1 Tax=Blepharisma stoltei TaxID=1481888 RepID=A0AAU9JLJ4_9CILI|nr:unnamed protein product [Blepharisma stoltei]